MATVTLKNVPEELVRMLGRALAAFHARAFPGRVIPLEESIGGP